MANGGGRRAFRKQVCLCRKEMVLAWIHLEIMEKTIPKRISLEVCL